MRTLVAAASLLVACATTPATVNPALPAWVERGSGRCPNLPEHGVSPKNQCGIGVATNIASPKLGRMDAEARARGELEAVLRSKQKSIARELRDSNPADTQVSLAAFEELVNRTARAGTHPLSWHDETANAHYACAMVDLETLKKVMGEIANSASLSEGARKMFLIRASALVDEWSRMEAGLPAER